MSQIKDSRLLPEWPGKHSVPQAVARVLTEELGNVSLTIHDEMLFNMPCVVQNVPVLSFPSITHFISMACPRP